MKKIILIIFNITLSLISSAQNDTLLSTEWYETGELKLKENPKKEAKLGFVP